MLTCLGPVASCIACTWSLARPAYPDIHIYVWLKRFVLARLAGGRGPTWLGPSRWQTATWLGQSAERGCHPRHPFRGASADADSAGDALAEESVSILLVSFLPLLRSSTSICVLATRRSVAPIERSLEEKLGPTSAMRSCAVDEMEKKKLGDVAEAT